MKNKRGILITGTRLEIAVSTTKHSLGGRSNNRRVGGIFDDAISTTGPVTRNGSRVSGFVLANPELEKFASVEPLLAPARLPLFLVSLSPCFLPHPFFQSVHFANGNPAKSMKTSHGKNSNRYTFTATQTGAWLCALGDSVANPTPSPSFRVVLGLPAISLGGQTRRQWG
jgi:hypothetical protein